MTACFVRPTITETYQRLSTLFSTNVLGGAPIIPETNEYYLIGNDVAAAELYYSLSAQQWEQTQDDTACCDALIRKNAPLGLIPRGATFSNVYIVVTGPPFAEIPSNTQCQIGSNTYNLSTETNANPSLLGADGHAILLMTSLEPGSKVNVETNTAIDNISAGLSGVSATLTVVPAGWDTTVNVFGNACGGRDAETCEQFRTRVIARKKLSPIADFAYIRDQALTWPCVTRVLLRSCEGCCNDGQLQLYAFSDDSFPYGIMPDTALPGLNAFIFGTTPGIGLGKAPVGVFGAFYPVGRARMNINFFNMTCINGAQFLEIQRQLTALFATFVPGQTVCSKLINAIVVGVNPKCCDYILTITNDDHHAIVDCNNDITPLCDYLPIINSITYTTAMPQNFVPLST